MNNQQFDLKLLEYPGPIRVVSCHHGVFFINNGNYIILKNDLPVKLFEANCEYYTAVIENNVLYYSCREGVNSQYNLDTKVLKVLEEDQIMVASPFFNNKGNGFIAGTGLDLISEVLYCRHLDSKKLYARDEEEHEKVLVQDDFIVTKNGMGGLRARVNKVSCYDKYLKEQWHFIIEKGLKHYGVKLSLYNDTIIFNGLYKDTMHTSADELNFKIFALYLHNGKEKWRIDIRGEHPNCSSVIDDHIYVVQSGHVLIFDVSDGRLMLKKPMGFEGHHQATAHVYSIFQYNEQIFVSSLLHKAIRIFDLQMNLVQQIDFPKPLTPHCYREFVSGSLLFASSQDQIYFVLEHDTGLSALAVLKPTTKEPTITIRPRPDFKHEHVLYEGEKGHAYKLSLDSSDLDAVVSGGEYELMEIGQYCGVDISEHEHGDVKLNHHLIYSLKKSLLPAGTEEKLEQMLERIDNFFIVNAVGSVLTGKRFIVTIEYR